MGNSLHRIQVGDVVLLQFTRNNVFGFLRGPDIKVLVLYTPSDTGDLWIFRVQDNGKYDGLEFSLNPCCSDFVGIISTLGIDDGH